MSGWLIALAVFILFLLMKVGVRIYWDSESMTLKIRIGPVRFSLSTEKKHKKPKKPKKRKMKAEPSAQQTADKLKKEKKKMSPSLKSWIMALIERRGELLSLLGKVLTSPTLDLLRLHVAVGGKEPEMTYGKICAGMGAGLPLLYNTFRVKKDDIHVNIRYDLSKILILAEIETTIRIGEIFSIIGALIEIFSIIGALIGLFVKILITKSRNDKVVRTV